MQILLNLFSFRPLSLEQINTIRFQYKWKYIIIFSAEKYLTWNNMHSKHWNNIRNTQTLFTVVSRRIWCIKYGENVMRCLFFSLFCKCNSMKLFYFHFKNGRRKTKISNLFIGCIFFSLRPITMLLVEKIGAYAREKSGECQG